MDMLRDHLTSTYDPYSSYRREFYFGRSTLNILSRVVSNFSKIKFRNMSRKQLVSTQLQKNKLSLTLQGRGYTVIN